jgi:hypothetical protein
MKSKNLILKGEVKGTISKTQFAKCAPCKFQASCVGCTPPENTLFESIFEVGVLCKMRVGLFSLLIEFLCKPNPGRGWQKQFETYSAEVKNRKSEHSAPEIQHCRTLEATRKTVLTNEKISNFVGETPLCFSSLTGRLPNIFSSTKGDKSSLATFMGSNGQFHK